jgi:hypothetical protein
MGTAASNFTDLAAIGIIPRTVCDIFREVEARREKSAVEVRASFIEIYNEQIIDLLCDAHLKDPKYPLSHAGTRTTSPFGRKRTGPSLSLESTRRWSPMPTKCSSCCRAAGKTARRRAPS